MLTRTLTVLVPAFVLFAPSVAHAQSADPGARGMVRQAMEDYQNLDIDGALNRLRLALNACGRSNCSPQMVARVHVSMGIVAVGGQNDASTGASEFAEALRLDPNAEPDAMLVTPEITAAFTQARQRGGGTATTDTSGGTGNGSARSGGTGRTGNGGTATSGGNSGGGAAASPSGSGTLLHTPVAEQLENTPVPVYVEAGTGATAATSYVVHYRGLGMSNYSDIPMSRVANGWGVEIPCGQVIRPTLQYYVTAANAGGAVLASTGSAQSPVQITVVATRSQPAPALPGRMPAEQCGEDCPPGMTGPQCRHAGSGGAAGGSAASSGRGSRQLGDPCQSNNQCAEGMHCSEGACSSGEAAGGGSSGPSTPSSSYRFAVDLGGGLALPYIAGGQPSYSEFQDYGGGAGATCGMPLTDGSGRTAYSCPYVMTPGFGPTGMVYFGVRAWLFSRISIGVSVRYQPDASSIGTLPSLFIGGRAYVSITGDGFARHGPTVAVFVGSGVGQMQAKPTVSSSSQPSAHIISGLNNVHLGIHAEYPVSLFHVGVDLAAQFQVPNFLFVLDLQAVVGLHF